MPINSARFNLLKTVLLTINLFAIAGLIGAILATYIPSSLVTIFSVLALIYPILVIINLVFVFTWIFLKSKWFMLSLMIILLGYSNISKNIQLSGNSIPTKDTAYVNVLSYNVQLFGLIEEKSAVQQKRDEILEFVRREDPRIICFQEYYSVGITPYAPLEEMKTELNLNTHYYESYFSPRHNQLTGLVILSKYPAIDKGKLKFNGTRTFGIYTDLLIGMDTVRVFNIHLASIQLLPADIDFVINAGQEKEENIRQHALTIYTKLTDAFLLRERQMRYLVDQLSNCHYPVILCGDFNDTPSSFVYDQITSELGDCFRDEGKGISTTYAGQIPFLRIDYIMKSDHFKTMHYKRHKIDLSDHFPISSSFAIQKGIDH